MMIMKLQIKLLPNLVGQPEYDPHQSGMVIRLQHIYHFLLFHAIILPTLDVYGLYYTILYHF